MYQYGKTATQCTCAKGSNLITPQGKFTKKIFPYRSNVWFDSLHRSIQRHRESFVNPMISNSFPTVDEENENEIRDDNQVLQCDLQKFHKNSTKII